MRITIFLFIVGIYLVSAKYLSYETKESNALLRTKRSDDSSSSTEQDEISNESDDDDDFDNDDDDNAVKDVKQQKLEDKLRRKALKQQEKEEKAQRKEEEKREKEERKRLEKLEKLLRKEEEKQRKELEKSQKQERKRQEKQRKELEKLEKETLQGGPVDSDFLETEEENSVELSDVWKEYVYVKYGLNLASTKLEKQAALNRYLQEELRISQNSTETERFQAVIQLIQNKLANDATARTALKNQLLSHTNAVSIQKLRTDLEKDIEELNNKTEVLNNVTLPWVPLAKQQIDQKRSFLQTVHQFLSSILPSWLTGGQSAQNPSNGNGPVTGSIDDVSNVNSESNVASGSNVVTGNQGNAVTADQSNSGVSTGSTISPSNADSNSPAQGSGPILTDSNGNVVVTNNNENKASSAGIAGPGDNNGVVGGSGDNNIANSEIPSSVNNGATANSDNIASNNINDNTSPADTSVVPPDNTDDVLNSNNNPINILDPAVNPSVPSDNVNVVNVNNDVPSPNPSVISSTNNGPENVDNTADLNLNNGPPILVNEANNAPVSSSEPQSSDAVAPENAGNVISSSSSDSTSSVKPGIPSDNSVDLPIVNGNDNVPSTVPDVASISDGGNPTLNAGNVVTVNIGSSQGNEVTSNNEANEVSLGASDGTVDINVVSSGADPTTSANDANVLSSNNNENSLSVTPDAASSANSDVISLNNGENVIQNAPDSTIISPTGIVDSEVNNPPTNNADVAVSTDVQQNVNSAVTTSDLNAETVNPDTQTGSSDTISVNNIDNPPSLGAPAEVVPPDSSVVTSEGNTVAIVDSNTNVASTSETDIVSSGAPASDVVSPVVTESSSLPSNDPNDTVSVNNVNVVAENASPVAGVISEGGEAVSSAVSPSGIDNVDVAPVDNVLPENASPVAGVISEGSEAVSSTVSSSGIETENVAPVNNVVAENASPVADANPEGGELVSSADPSESNNVDVAPISIVAPENVSPVAGVISGDSETVNSAASSSAIDTVNIVPIGTEVVPSEGNNPIPSVGPNDSATENVNNVNAPDLPVTDSNPNVNVDPNVNNAETTVAPEVINTIQTLDGVGSTAQSVPIIITESPIDKGNEQLTTISDIISNVNTVLTTVAETSVPSEASQQQTSESSSIDTVSPVELPASLATEGVTIPAEPAASVVEVLPQ